MGVALESLSEEEAYLFSIISDPSGLDLAEFCWYAPSDHETDECWRAWPFQWAWFRDVAPLQIDQCARSVGKSLSIKLRAFAFPFLWPGQEMVITAPELNHLEAIVELVEGQFHSTRLGREMMVGKRGGTTHRPFSMKFENGARIMGRIPQKDGRGVKGLHPMWLEADEVQDYPEKGWVELQQTLKRGIEGSVWRAHGVTKGVQDFFYKFTTDLNSNWKVHKFTGMHRPTWTDDERQEAIQFYGSKDNPDYRRNILGEHGDATNPIFVLTQLMKNVDDIVESNFNSEEYYHIKIDPEYVTDFGGDILTLIKPPGIHLARYKTFWIGMDIGWTRDPSEILVFAEYMPTKEETTLNKRLKKAVPQTGMTRLKMIARITMRRIGAPDQAAVVGHLIDTYRPRAFALDATGAGLPLFQYIQKENPAVLDTIKGYNFSSKILVDFDQRVEVDEFHGDAEKDAGIERQVLEYATDKLREIVDQERIWLPWDTEVLKEWQGQNYTIERSNMDPYGRRRFSNGSFHTLDAGRMAILGWKQFAIEEFTKNKKRESVIDMPLY